MLHFFLVKILLSGTKIPIARKLDCEEEKKKKKELKYPEHSTF